jgi:hypothetical protein
MDAQCVALKTDDWLLLTARKSHDCFLVIVRLFFLNSFFLAERTLARSRDEICLRTVSSNPPADSEN